MFMPSPARFAALLATPVADPAESAEWLPMSAAHSEIEVRREGNGYCGVHVLIVDDNAVNRLVATSLCEMFGCTSECVEDGATAVEAAASGRFDLVLMDIMMPGMDGVEATRLIRSGLTAASQTPILALTANADPADAAFYRRCGMNGVVEKPIKPEHLLAAIRSLFDDDGVPGAGESAEIAA